MMKSQINTMRQLQELVLIRDEHHQTGDGSHLDSLNDSIDALRKKLIPQAAGIYDRLYKRNHVVLAALSGNVCSGCGMQVPIAQAQQVRLAQHLVTCSNCGRILFAEEGETPRNIAEKPDRDEIRTGVSRFSAEELMVPNLKAATAAEAIGELADAMEQHGFISNGTNLAAAAMDRENVLPTTMGEGFAFPHVRGVEGGGLTFALGISPGGVEWVDGQKVNIIFLSAIPVAVSAFYLRLLSDLVSALHKKDARDALLKAQDSASLWKALSKVTRNIVK